MRLCVSVPCFFGNMNFTDAIRSVKACGYDAVETWGWEGLDLQETRRVLDDCGVEMLDMCTSEFDMTDPAKRVIYLDGLKKSCEAAQVLGVKKLITQVGPDTGAARVMQHEAIVETLRQAAPILKAADVQLMVEPLNSYVDHKGYYLTSSLEGAEIIREVNDPQVKMVYDIYHMQIMEGNIIPNLTAELDTIVHLHAAGNPGRHEPWLGETDYKNVMAAAEKAGYKGMLGLEYIPVMDPMESLKECRRIYG